MTHQVGSITSLLSPRQRLSLCGVHMTTGANQQQQNQHLQSLHSAEANNDVVSTAGASTPTRSVHPSTSPPASQPMMSLHHARGLGLGLGLGLATVTGPVVCATKALAVMPPQSPQHQQQQQQQGVGVDHHRPPTPSMLMGDRVVALCQGASGDGPASCFNEGKQLCVSLITPTKGTGTTGSGANPWQWQWLVELCAGAPSVGPALCFRRAQSLFRTSSPSTTGIGSSSSSSLFSSLGVEDSLRSLLCVGAHSDDPATCAASAPLYLSPLEKVQLCAGAPASRANEPTKCLQVAEQASRSFAQAPRRALGQFLDSLLQPSERRSRDLLIGMCAFTVSQAPVASAECLRSAPSSLPHDEAVRMCTDIAPAAAHSTSSHAMLCRTILPRDWSATDAAMLCEGRGTNPTTRNNNNNNQNNNSSTGSGNGTLSSRRQIEAAVRCAVETSSFSASSSTSQKLRLSHAQAASLCASEGEKGTVLACYRAAVATGLSPSSPLLSPSLLVGLCTAATSPAPGTCLHRLASFPYTQSLDVDVGVASYLCRQPQALHKLDCLALRRARAVVLSREDVDRCAATPRIPTSIQVK